MHLVIEAHGLTKAFGTSMAQSGYADGYGQARADFQQGLEASLQMRAPCDPATSRR
jgi:hypothetical protein